MIAELKTHVKLTWLPSFDATRTLNLQRERQRRLCFSVDQRHLCSHCYLSGNYVSLTSTTFFLRQLTSSPYVFLCFPVDQYHLFLLRLTSSLTFPLFPNWKAPFMFPFHVTIHAVPFHVNTCSLDASFLSTNPTTRHCNNMFCFDVLFSRYSPTSNLCVSINFRLTSSLYNSFPSHHEESPRLFFGGPAASMFLLLFDWPAAYMFPLFSGRPAPPFLFTFLRLSSSLYVSFVFGCWPPAFMFLIHVWQYMQPSCFLCFEESHHDAL